MNDEFPCYYQARISQKEFDKMDDCSKKKNLIGVFFNGRFYPACRFYEKHVDKIEEAQAYADVFGNGELANSDLTLEDIAKDKRRAFYIVKRKAKLPNYDE